MAKWKCSVCGYIYDEAREKVPFAELPDDWTCPVCGAPKSAFNLIEGAGEREVAEGEFPGTVADQIVAQLAAYGVRYVYGIPGDSNLPLVDAIRRSADVDFVLVRHEETAAFMASARYKIFNEIGVCLSIAGPGTTNLITGLLDAATDRSPVLALLGQVTEVRLGSEAFQEVDQLALYHPFTVYAETISAPGRAANVVNTAVKKAYAEHGVAALSLPTDVLAAPAVGGVGDVREALPRLLDLVPAKDMDKDFQKEVRGYRDEHLRDVAALRDRKTRPVHPGFVVSWLNELIPKDAVVTVDVGDHTYWFYKMFVADGQRTYLSANMASMAFALPAALAASLHERSRPTFCVTGDGGFGMLMADFTTAVREKLPIKVILFNDRRLKNIVKEQTVAGFPRYGVEFPNPNFAEYAASAGGLGVRVDDPDDFAPAVKKALKEKSRPSLIEVIVDPAAMAAPAGVALAAERGSES